MDWIKDYENMQLKMQKKCDKELPKTIDMYFYYVDEKGIVRKIKKQKWDCNNSHEITAGQLLYVINKRKIHPYVLDEILLYESGAGAAPATAGGGELKPIPLTITDIELKPSLFIYNEINSIFFFFCHRQGRARGREVAAAHRRKTAAANRRKPASTRKSYTPIDEFISPIDTIENMYMTKNWEVPDILFSINPQKIDELFTQALITFMEKGITIDRKEYNKMIIHIKNKLLTAVATAH
jgi:hypothetical protein